MVLDMAECNYIECKIKSGREDIQVGLLVCIDDADNQANIGDEFGDAGVAVHISLTENTLGGRSNLNVKLYPRKFINKFKSMANFCTRV